MAHVEPRPLEMRNGFENVKVIVEPMDNKDWKMDNGLTCAYKTNEEHNYNGFKQEQCRTNLASNAGLTLPNSNVKCEPDNGESVETNIQTVKSEPKEKSERDDHVASYYIRAGKTDGNLGNSVFPVEPGCCNMQIDSNKDLTQEPCRLQKKHFRVLIFG